MRGGGGGVRVGGRRESHSLRSRHPLPCGSGQICNRPAIVTVGMYGEVISKVWRGHQQLML